MDPTEPSPGENANETAPTDGGPERDSAVRNGPVEDDSTTAPDSGAGSAAPDAGADSATTPDEVRELDSLEADMAAVEQAIATLDEIHARGVGGELAANEISAAVSEERFGH